jgi:hypothetical protein
MSLRTITNEKNGKSSSELVDCGIKSCGKCRFRSKKTLETPPTGGKFKIVKSNETINSNFVYFCELFDVYLLRHDNILFRIKNCILGEK